MLNQSGLGLHFTFVTVFLVATTTYTCLGAQNITAPCLEHERLALLEFKHSVSDTFNTLQSWVGDDCCRWKRVECDIVSGHVDSLYLNGRRGKHLVVNKDISSLAALGHLKHLDLSGNSFKDLIPKFIGSFKHLTYLNLSNADFLGDIPRHIGNLSNLQFLDLSYNDYIPLGANAYVKLFTDDVSWISGLTSLKYLDLSSVYISGAENYDMMISMIPSLEVLGLNGCSLSGQIPILNSSATISKIKHLDLGFNDFIGELPRFFQNMTSLKFLDLSFYNLSNLGNFVNLINNIPCLQELHLVGCGIQNIHLSPARLNLSTPSSNIKLLDLRGNPFGGKFPSVLTNLTSVRVLDLSECELNSTVPIMPSLLELDLSRNNFTRIEQFGFWRQCHLTRLSVSRNFYQMELNYSPTTNLSECSRYALERLYLDFSFNGSTIPESFGRLTNLRDLDLSSNVLTGQIPESLGRLVAFQKLILRDNQLVGPIPASLGRLSRLKSLDLSSNRLTGNIPESLVRLRLLEVFDLSNNQLNGSIPESLGSLGALKHLILRNNHLTGPIPTYIGSLVLLQEVSMSFNFINGTIPVSLGKLSKLRDLDISNNDLEGVVSDAHFDNILMLKELSLASNNKLTINISREWIPPFQLTSVNLSSCKIENGFPQWLRTQRKLVSLVLSKSSISGSLPTWLRRMPIIPYLDLSHNNLIGPLTNLPGGDDLGNYRLIEIDMGGYLLHVQNNLFNGSIPKSLCERTNLKFLNLSKNKLTGKIPKCLGNLQLLKTMILSSNRLSGVIPSSIGDSSLEWLKLNDNNFSGELPQELGNLSNLMVLDLGDNKFSANIPDWIGKNLSELVILRLHKNNLQGRIPRSLCKNRKLQILDVAHNNLTGHVPPCLGGLNGMVLGSPVFLVSFGDNDENVNQVMKGVELEYSSILEFVINMDLSSNKLVGGIPTELTALAALVGLNLSNNLLTGSIPDKIGNLEMLNSLDFSGNRLTGMIPPSLAALHFLSHLNLSHNNLSGQIPTGNQLQTLNEPSIYTGNKDLCGDPLPNKCSTDQVLTPTLENSYQVAEEPKMVWFYLDVASGFATGFWGIIGVLVFKKQWRHNLFMFAEVTIDKIYVAIVVTVSKMKTRNA